MEVQEVVMEVQEESLQPMKPISPYQAHDPPSLNGINYFLHPINFRLPSEM